MQESQHLEFKRLWKDEYLKWICAFANTNGGTLMLGYNDQGEAVGLKNIDKLLEDIPNKVRDVLGILIDVNLITENNLSTLHLKVAPYPYPISYKGEYHYRSGSTKQELKGAALDKFLMRKQGITWDAVPVPGVKITDLNEKALNYFREQAIHNQRLPNTLINESSAGLLEKLRLTTGDYLKRAAIMLFHPEPDYFVTGAVIKIGAFGTSNADLLHHDEITGNLFTQVEEALEVIKLKYLKASISYGELYRKERFPLPIPALREALLNAVVHKDYASHTAIQISIYPNKLMLWNPGQLPESWTLEKLLSKHESIPYNPDIANAFFRAGLIESWGRGIERIIEACQQDNYPAPQWKLEPNGLWVVFELENTEQPQGTDDCERLRSFMNDYEHLQPEEKKLIEQLYSFKTITRKQVVELLGVQQTKAYYLLDSLVGKNILKRQGQGRGTYYQLNSSKQNKTGLEANLRNKL